jgi:hypothetical protein
MIQESLKTSMFAGTIYSSGSTTSGNTIQLSTIQISRLIMIGYSNFQKMDWSITNSSISQLQKLILKRTKALLRMVMANPLQTFTPMVLSLTSTWVHMKLINFEMLHVLPQMVRSSLCLLCVVLHFLNMDQTLQSMHFQHSFLLGEVVLMNQDNIRCLRRIGQTISFNFVVDDSLDIHGSDTGHSILLCDMRQRKLQGGIRLSSRAKIPSH